MNDQLTEIHRRWVVSEWPKIDEDWESLREILAQLVDDVDYRNMVLEHFENLEEPERTESGHILTDTPFWLKKRARIWQPGPFTQSATSAFDSDDDACAVSQVDSEDDATPTQQPEPIDSD